MRRDRTKRKKNKIRGKSREQKTNPPVATILAIDDEPSFLEFYESMLTARGYLVVCSRTVKDAISRLQANSDIALILCDINMGEQSGFELLSYI
ncbi:MAG: response regulator, partial [Proteobacteria bacterium]|nr:response regulator [Pseudomonadota bacterium]